MYLKYYDEEMENDLLALSGQGQMSACQGWMSDCKGMKPTLTGDV